MITRWTISLLLCLPLCGAKQTMAQGTENPQQEAIRKQARIDELRAQLAEIQAQLDAISIAKPPQSETLESVATTTPPPSHFSPEQQLEGAGKATEEHHTFAENEEDAPRLFNAAPKAPSRAFLPNHTRNRKNPPK